jgi:predicted choloylglycine hydrolase
MERIPFTFRAFEELEPGEKWRRFFEEMWPWYRRWYLQDGDEARPTYGTCLRMLRAHMPELLPTYDRLVELGGGGDLEARVLALYDPPPYLSACTQGVRAHDGRPVLVRNYDYSPSRLEGVVWSTAWNGRRVIGMGDCLWGLLDGLNDAGLAVSLTFGGRRVVGAGFGIPLVVRYLLETCTTVNEAAWALPHIPVNLAHNLTLLDRSGEYVTVYLAPDREPVFKQVPVATNHQESVEWLEHANATRTLERECEVLALLEAGVAAEQFVAAFLGPSLYSGNYSRGFGTLYTAVYYPAEGRAEYLWPGEAPWTKSFASFTEDARTQLLVEAAVA